MELAQSVSMPKSVASRTLDSSLVLLAFVMPLMVGFTIDQLLISNWGQAYENLPRAEFFYVAWPLLAVGVGFFVRRRGAIILSRGMFLNALFVGLVVLSYLAFSTIWKMAIGSWLPI